MPDPDAHIWSEDASFATTLFVAMRDRFAEPAPASDDDPAKKQKETPFEIWDPETIRAEIISEWGVEPCEGALDRALMCLTFMVDPDRFRRGAGDFVNLCNVFSGAPFDPVGFDPADVCECAWGLTEILLLVPPDADRDEEIFGPEVRAYVGHVLDEEGFISGYDVLKIADWPARTVPVSVHGPGVEEQILQRDRSRGEDITSRIDSGVTRLIQQLESLTLVSGDAKGLRKRILGAAR